MGSCFGTLKASPDKKQQSLTVDQFLDDPLQRKGTFKNEKKKSSSASSSDPADSDDRD